MPEGDSIHRLAKVLAPVLVGNEVVGLTARRLTRDVARSVVGHRIASVSARGKNLLVAFDDERVLHIHLRMEGRIFVEKPRSAFWKAPALEPDLRLETSGGAIVGKHLPVLRLLSGAQAKRDPSLAGLGPDLTTAAWNEDEALARLRALGDREVGAAILVQRGVAGIGNVYKSEVLFLEAIDPRTLVRDLGDDELRAVLRRASTLLRSNLGRGPRVTRRSLAGPRLWVYGRANRPCLRCGTPVRMFHQSATRGGADGVRSTYHCPKCQPSRGILDP